MIAMESFLYIFFFTSPIASSLCLSTSQILKNICFSFTYHLTNIMEITLYLILTLTITLLHNKSPILVR